VLTYPRNVVGAPVVTSNYFFCLPGIESRSLPTITNDYTPMTGNLVTKYIMGFRAHDVTLSVLEDEEQVPQLVAGSDLSGRRVESP
jgi:hypothetical protein